MENEGKARGDVIHIYGKHYLWGRNQIMRNPYGVAASFILNFNYSDTSHLIVMFSLCQFQMD